MSRGLGALQRRLLAAVEAADPPMLAARDLVGRELAGHQLPEAVRRWHATGVAVRRALAGLARRGLLVDCGRIAFGGARQSAVVYATPAFMAEMSQAVE